MVFEQVFKYALNSLLHNDNLIVGLTSVIRLGFLIDFLSHAAVVGFMGGAAITIALQQLKGFLGIKTKDFTTKTNIVSVMRSVFSSAHHGVCSFSITQCNIKIIKL